MSEPASILTSWKEIAAHLGKGVRTVQRWERELGLPVRRPANGKHVIIAKAADLDEWIARFTPNAQSSDVSFTGRATSNACCDCKALLVEANARIAELVDEIGALKKSLAVKSAIDGAPPRATNRSHSSTTQ